MDPKSLHDGESEVGQKNGVIIVDHGSRRKESNLLLNEFVLMFKTKTGYPIVEPAYTDIPSLADAAALEHPGFPSLVTSPLGFHELLVDVVKDRIECCSSRVDGKVEECGICAGTARCKLKGQDFNWVGLDYTGWKTKKIKRGCECDAMQRRPLLAAFAVLIMCCRNAISTMLYV